MEGTSRQMSTGVGAVSFDPSPTWPKSLLPQHLMSALLLRAHVLRPDAVTCV
jgi:hypothetical protein